MKNVKSQQNFSKFYAKPNIKTDYFACLLFDLKMLNKLLLSLLHVFCFFTSKKYLVFIISLYFSLNKSYFVAGVFHINLKSDSIFYKIDKKNLKDFEEAFLDQSK